jgi:hypothetical protein
MVSAHRAQPTAVDESLTVYMQTDSPGEDKESNWLPTPDGPFWPIFRPYGNGETLLDGTWTLPTITRKS